MRYYTGLAALLLLIALGLTHPHTARAQAEAQLADEYFNDGEYEKALGLFEKLYGQNPDKDDFLYKLVRCYMELDNHAGAVQVVQKVIKKSSGKPQYIALLGSIYADQGDGLKAESTWNDLIGKQLKAQPDFAAVGAYFEGIKRLDWAQRTYQAARTALKQPSLFADRLAAIAKKQADYQAATQELLLIYDANPSLFTQVRNELVSFATADNLPVIETVLLQAQQKSTNQVGYTELLYEVYLAAGQYADALTQARALDKMNKESGQRVFTLAQTLQNNAKYDLSNQLLDYIIEQKKTSPFYMQAFFEKAKNLELIAFEAKPLDTNRIRATVNEYNKLFDQFGRKETFVEALYRKARLCIFYLNDIPEGEKELEVIQNLAIQPMQKAEAKLLQGDILLLEGEYNKAKLKYGEVEEEFKEAQVGAMAKFRSSRLDYYKGDFEAAAARLKILKDNTSNDISNDAIRLFLLIQDNLGFDTVTYPLQRFANAQLLIYQKQYGPALTLLDSLQYAYPNNTLADDILWEQANIALAQNDIPGAIKLLDAILEGHGTGIYGDDALFTKAELTQYALQDLETAQKLYLDLLIKYPGSLFKVEARKRIRILRGDEI